MLKVLCTAFLGVFSYGAVIAQLKSQFCIGNHPECKEVRLVLKAKTGNCFIQSGISNDLIRIISNQTDEEPVYIIKDEESNKIDVINLSLDRNASKGVSKYIFQQYVSNGKESVNDVKEWFVSLNGNKPYRLDLIYGLGNVDLNLAGLAMKHLAINSGGADVKIWYSHIIENKVDMDTLSIKIDMGSLTLNQVNLSRAKVIIGEVGVGDIFMDLQHCNSILQSVNGSVGIGDLVIALPPPNVPIIVRVNNSWVSRIGISSNLRKIGQNTYVNKAYERNKSEAVTFSLDVSMGEITLKE